MSLSSQEAGFRAGLSWGEDAAAWALPGLLHLLGRGRLLLGSPPCPESAGCQCSAPPTSAPHSEPDGEWHLPFTPPSLSGPTWHPLRTGTSSKSHVAPPAHSRKPRFLSLAQAPLWLLPSCPACPGLLALPRPAPHGQRGPQPPGPQQVLGFMIQPSAAHKGL